MSFAVKKDGTGWRAVDGHEPNPAVMTWEFPDYDYETFSIDEPPPAKPLLVEALNMAIVERDRLLSIAAIRIAPLQDAIDTGQAPAEKVELLMQWKLYRIALSEISEQKDFPNKITWPLSPEGK